MNIICSAGDVDAVVPVTNKGILFFLRKFVSILSYPTPCLDITLRFLQLDKISESNLATRSVSPSNFGNCLVRLALETSSIISYSNSGCLSKTGFGIREEWILRSYKCSRKIF